MEIKYKDIKKGEIKVKAESLDDLWYLSHVIDQGDTVEGSTTRKIKIGKEDDRNQKVVKKTVFLKINAEKIEFHKYSNSLRINGTIIEGHEDIPKGSYHTINVEPGTIIKIIKSHWLKYQLDKIKEASENEPPKILICIMDREEAYLAILKKQGYELLTRLKGSVQKKADVQTKTENFYSEIIKTIKEYDERKKFDNIIIASPAFWKEDLMKNLKDADLKKKIVQATCSSCDENAIMETMKRSEVEKVLHADKISKEAKLVEKLFYEISKEGNAVYGLDDTENAVNAGAVKKLLITDEYIQNLRQEGKYEKVDNLLKNVEASQGSIHIISSEHEGGKKLEGIGGIAGILRYKLNY